jgi:chromosome segregation ATPase
MTRITVGFVDSAPLTRHRGWRVSLACLFGFLALTQLAGCATSGDPHEGGFINGIVGLSGGYQRRLDERETILSGERAEGRRLETEQRRLEAERDAVRNDLDRAQRRLAAQQQRIAAERARIQALRRQTAADRARLAELNKAQGRARAVNRTIKQADPARDALPGLEAKTRDINREIEEIEAAVGIISGV